MKNLKDKIFESMTCGMDTFFNKDYTTRTYNNYWSSFTDTSMVKIDSGLYAIRGSFFRKGVDEISRWLNEPEYSGANCIVLNNRPTSVMQWLSSLGLSVFNCDGQEMWNSDCTICQCCMDKVCSQIKDRDFVIVCAKELCVTNED